jgi:hypothetical protein
MLLLMFVVEIIGITMKKPKTDGGKGRGRQVCILLCHDLVIGSCINLRMCHPHVEDDAAQNHYELLVLL